MNKYKCLRKLKIGDRVILHPNSYNVPEDLGTVIYVDWSKYVTVNYFIEFKRNNENYVYHGYHFDYLIEILIKKIIKK